MAKEDQLRTIGKKIKYLRERLKYSQDTLAEKMGVVRGTIARWETGERAIHITEIARLAKLLRVSTEEILTGFKTKNVSIHQATGLSERAIAVLREAQAFEHSQPANFVNELLEFKYLTKLHSTFQDYQDKKNGMPRFEGVENITNGVEKTLKQLHNKIQETDLAVLEYAYVQRCVNFLKNCDEKREWVAVEIEKGENLRTDPDY